jgi:replication factor C subunit 2/4
MPHFLFYGPPGTGKTSTILALARELFGYGSCSSSFLMVCASPDMIKDRVLELNASDERGIDVVREKVALAFLSVMLTPSRSSRLHKPPQAPHPRKTTRALVCPHASRPLIRLGFKIIILDEADAMTKDAQSALRYGPTMERLDHHHCHHIIVVVVVVVVVVVIIIIIIFIVIIDIIIITTTTI